MPTYIVKNLKFNLSSKQKKNLAEGITKVHSIVTRANTYFANDNKVLLVFYFYFKLLK